MLVNISLKTSAYKEIPNPECKIVCLGTYFFKFGTYWNKYLYFFYLGTTYLPIRQIGTYSS